MEYFYNLGPDHTGGADQNCLDFFTGDTSKDNHSSGTEQSFTWP